MKKTIVVLCMAIIIMITGISIFVTARLFKMEKVGQTIPENNIVNIEKNNNKEAKNTIETSSANNEKVSPSAKLEMIQFFAGCGHTVKNEYKVPSAIVNMNKEKIEKYYSGWNVEYFSKDYIRLYKMSDGICNEHYILRENNGYIDIYVKKQNNEEELFRATDILTKYLSESDKESLENGIEVVGKSNLETMLEDFQ